VVLSGILPNPPEILGLLDSFGARVVEDDLANCGRRLLFPPSEKEEPFQALTEIYFSLPPCPTKDSPISDRLQFILERVERSGAKGVIFCMVKFCEPELFDVPLLVEGLKERGLATLIVDVELNRGVSGQLATRLEAFVEMLR
jgi:benzoyl-CoA reductase/2-hydroxyglutaryl-CoA dehydratase subunit BcrC/BadD/HgdB